MMAAQSHTVPTPRLDELLAGLVEDEVPALNVTGITLDSRAVTPGCAFLARAGTQQHGLRYAADAIAAGAASVLWEPAAALAAPQLPVGAVSIPVPDLSQKLGLIADRFYGAPSAALRVVGITGTNGKSSTAHLISGALAQVGRASASVGTLGTGRPGALQPSALTTPDALGVHAALADFVSEGVESVALEVSSHALVQGRVRGVRFDTAVFTNLSRDHLDYHGSMSEYGAAKAQLFAMPGLHTAIINTDDPFGRELAAQLPAGPRLVSVGTVAPDSSLAQSPAAAHVELVDIQLHSAGLKLSFAGSFGSGEIASPLLGRFNAHNLLSAFALLRVWGEEAESAAQALSEVQAPPGRMEAFGGGTQPLVIVDYAHTPDALSHALRAAREHTGGTLWCVFGCGGDRDRGKRPQMGAVVAEHADRIVITDDNPRTEAGDRIVADIQSGMPTDAVCQIERDRRAAIAYAIEQAPAGDTVVVAGKGHENYQIVASERLELSDRDEVRQCLEARA